MICEFCNEKIGRHGGHFNKHIHDKHGINDFKEYILKTKYQNIKPVCLCGCGLETKFVNGEFKKYYHGHNTQYIHELNRDLNLENDIVNEYINGLLVEKLVIKYNLDRSVIYKILNRHDVVKTISKSKQKYFITEDIFEKIDTEEKAYWLGFLYADGYNYTVKKSVSLTLCNKDIDHLYKFKDFLKTDKPIRRNSDSSSKVVMENIKISNDLCRHGMVQAKTHIIKYPKIDENLDKHFIRGYFDGDGCISYGKNIGPSCGISIVSNKEFLESIVEKIKIHFSYTKRHKERKDNILTISTGGIKNILYFYDYIYKDSNIYLDRKKNKFNEWIDYYLDNFKTRDKTNELLNKINYGKN